MKIARQYSGDESKAFWNALNSIKNRTHKEHLYRKACDLQVLENVVLHDLEIDLARDEEQ